MVRETNAEVLIVGAGPVGMTTGLLLAEQDVKAALIDTESSTAAQSYACALHPRSLAVLDRFGLIKEILEWGRRIDTVAFYEGTTRRAEIKLSALAGNSQSPVKFPFLVVLPQNALEWLLERTFSRLAGAEVNWHHRLADLRSDAGGVVAHVDELGGTALGYIVPHWEQIVRNTARVSVPALVGADGHRSLVRRCLGIAYEQVGEPELYWVLEFETEAGPGNEVRIVLDETTTNVLWPLPGNRCRWSFQVVPGGANEEFPEKERRSNWMDDPHINQRITDHARKLVQQRAPWFHGEFRKLDWVSYVQFERRLARHFGDGRCWLAGDAAHQTGPVGVQSLNLGLREAGEIAAAIKASLRGENSTSIFETFDQRNRKQWLQLLGLNGALKTTSATDDWVKRRAARILPCLPASGDDLAQCLTQLHLELV
jgi:NADPH-dependent dioxygenase